MNHAAGPRRIAVASLRQRIAGVGGGPLEGIRAAVVFTLLLTECLEDQRGGLLPGRVEAGSVAGGFPIAVRQPDGVAE